ncbi:hypothetical protein [Bacillus sp. AK128]
MQPTELRNMRVKQILLTNGLIVVGTILLFMVISVFTVKFSIFFLIMASLILIQGILGLLKGESTKSIFPIFEQVAIYEKEKMGREWSKQRKSAYVWNLLLSGLLFLQAYWNRDSTDIFKLEPMFFSIMISIVIIMINISILIHIRKVDRSNSQTDLKGYTWKSNLIAIVFGILFSFIMISISLFYIISTL